MAWNSSLHDTQNTLYTVFQSQIIQLQLSSWSLCRWLTQYADFLTSQELTWLLKKNVYGLCNWLAQIRLLLNDIAIFNIRAEYVKLCTTVYWHSVKCNVGISADWKREHYEKPAPTALKRAGGECSLPAKMSEQKSFAILNAFEI